MGDTIHMPNTPEELQGEPKAWVRGGSTGEWAAEKAYLLAGIRS